MKVNVVLDVDWDSEVITVQEIQEFLNTCGEGYNIDVRVISIEGEK